MHLNCHYYLLYTLTLLHGTLMRAAAIVIDQDFRYIGIIMEL